MLQKKLEITVKIIKFGFLSIFINQVNVVKKIYNITYALFFYLFLCKN